MLKSPKTRKLFDILYLACLALVVIVSFKDTTMISYSWTQETLHVIRFIITIIVAAKIVLSDGKWTIKNILVAVLVGGSLLYTWFQCPYPYVYDLGILILGAYNVNYKNILKVYLSVEVPFVLITTILSQTNIITDLIYYRPSTGDKKRHSFGSVFPTDYAAHILYLAVCYVFLRGKKITYAEISVIGALGIFCHVFCGATTNAFLLILIAVFLLIYKLHTVHINSAGLYLLCSLAPVFAAVMIILSYAYNPSVRWMYALNKALHQRLKWGHLGFTRYSVKPFAQWVEMHGFGSGNGNIEMSKYFMLDCSYVNILLRMGAVVLIAMLTAYVIISVRQVRAHHYIRLVMLAIIAVACVMEHHLLEISFTPLFLMLFAADEHD